MATDSAAAAADLRRTALRSTAGFAVDTWADALVRCSSHDLENADPCSSQGGFSKVAAERLSAITPMMF